MNTIRSILEQVLIEELKRAGILDISTPLFERFDFEPDLFNAGYEIHENLRYIIREAVLYMQTMSRQDLYLDDEDIDIKLFIFMTRQGIHIEIPVDSIKKIRRNKSDVPREFIEPLFRLNARKMEIVRRFYPEGSA